MENNEQQLLHESNEMATEKSVAKNTPDINTLSKEQLVELINEKLKAEKIANQSKTIEEIKKCFDAAHAEKVAKAREAYKSEHDGSEDGFIPDSDEADIDMQTAYSEYKKRLANEHSVNYQQKKNIIEKMEQLLQGDDVSQYNKQFRELIEEWKAIGHVQASEAQDINTKQKQLVDKFFENLKLNHAMRELDYKKNYEAKVKLCETAEALAQQTSATKSYSQIHSLHEQWKQIGAVQPEVREDLWKRFKAATNAISEHFHTYIEESKDRESANYEAKLAIIAEVETLIKNELNTRHEIDAAITKVEELQQKWRTIGIVPKAFNTEVYTTFRKACDQVYNKRREFYKEKNNVHKANLALKKKLIEQAEALKNSTDWKSTTEKFIALQKEWKKVGPVANKVSDDVWKKFRGACDYFFEQRDQAFGHADAEREKNYELKSQILEELKSAELPENTDELFKTLQNYQQRWNKIGVLPNKKNDIQQEFTQLVNKLYDKCASDDASKNLQRFKAKMELLNESSDGQQKINQERNRLIAKLKQLESDANTLANNIGFFSKSKKSDKLIADIENKIKVVHMNIDQINEKLDIIDAL